MKLFTVKGPSLKELYELSKDPQITVSRTPFGANPLAGEEKVYIKRAVPWKGVKGIDNLRKVNPRVADTIEKLRDASRSMAGKYRGVVIAAVGGRIKAMPYKSFMQMVAAGKADMNNIVGRWVPVRGVTAEEYERRVRELAAV